jgi:hypothetical protein
MGKYFLELSGDTSPQSLRQINAYFRAHGIAAELPELRNAGDKRLVYFEASDRAEFERIQRDLFKMAPPSSTDQKKTQDSPTITQSDLVNDKGLYGKAYQAVGPGKPIMAQVDGFNVTSGGFIQFDQFPNKPNNLTGWKIHLSVDPRDVTRATEIIADIYRSHHAKIFKVTNPKNTIGFANPADSQAGKMFTLYDTGEKNWPEIMREIEARFKAQGIKPSHPVGEDVHVKGSQYAYRRNDLNPHAPAGSEESYVPASEARKINPHQPHNPYNIHDPLEHVDLSQPHLRPDAGKKAQNDPTAKSFGKGWFSAGRAAAQIVTHAAKNASSAVAGAASRIVPEGKNYKQEPRIPSWDEIVVGQHFSTASGNEFTAKRSSIVENGKQIAGYEVGQPGKVTSRSDIAGVQYREMRRTGDHVFIPDSALPDDVKLKAQKAYEYEHRSGSEEINHGASTHGPQAKAPAGHDVWVAAGSREDALNLQESLRVAGVQTSRGKFHDSNKYHVILPGDVAHIGPEGHAIIQTGDRTFRVGGEAIYQPAEPRHQPQQQAQGRPEPSQAARDAQANQAREPQKPTAAPGQGEKAPANAESHHVAQPGQEQRPDMSAAQERQRQQRAEVERQRQMRMQQPPLNAGGAAAQQQQQPQFQAKPGVIPPPAAAPVSGTGNGAAPPGSGNNAAPPQQPPSSQPSGAQNTPPAETKAASVASTTPPQPQQPELQTKTPVPPVAPAVGAGNNNAAPAATAPQQSAGAGNTPPTQAANTQPPQQPQQQQGAEKAPVQPVDSAKGGAPVEAGRGKLSPVIETVKTGAKAQVGAAVVGAVIAGAESLAKGEGAKEAAIKMGKSLPGVEPVNQLIQGNYGAAAEGAAATVVPGASHIIEGGKEAADKAAKGDYTGAAKAAGKGAAAGATVAGGMMAGAAYGAAVGSIVPGVGTVVGGAVGAYFGAKAAEAVVDAAKAGPTNSGGGGRGRPGTPYANSGTAYRTRMAEEAKKAEAKKEEAKKVEEAQKEEAAKAQAAQATPPANPAPTGQTPQQQAQQTPPPAVAPAASQPPTAAANPRAAALAAVRGQQAANTPPVVQTPPPAQKPAAPAAAAARPTPPPPPQAVAQRQKPPAMVVS